jgi:Lon protease-like protein
MPSFEADLPLIETETVLFPQARLNLKVKGLQGRLAVMRCLSQDMPFGAVLMCPDGFQKLAEMKVVGTAAQIVYVERSSDDSLMLLARGHRRFRIIELLSEEPYPVARVLFPSTIVTITSGVLSLSNKVAAMFQRYAELAYEPSALKRREFLLPTSPVDLAFATATMLHIPPHEKQRLLETFNLNDLLSLLLSILRREIERLTSDESYKDEVRKQASTALPKMPPIVNGC